MNETLKVIENRRSVRKFSPELLSEEEKSLILQAALRAPTAGNMMLYSILEIEDQELKDQLAVTCDNQPFIATAPWVLVFLADFQRVFDFYTFSDAETACLEKGNKPRKPGKGDLLLACCDALISAQTAVIAAESLGIGSCYIGDILENAEQHRELFKLPPYTLPVTLLVMGRPAVVKAEHRLTSRFDREHVVFKNHYHPLTRDEFLHMYHETAARQTADLDLEQAVKLLGKNQYFRKFATDFAVEMNRSANIWLNDWA